MWKVIGSVLIVGVLLLIPYIAARRFAARQRQLGRWDQYGPLVETEKPPKGGYGSGDMGERLEIVGRWKAKVLRRRAPGEKPSP
jgi:hypothetical protein